MAGLSGFVGDLLVLLQDDLAVFSWSVRDKSPSETGRQSMRKPRAHRSRDIGQVVPILLQFLFWFTPIVYPISIVPEYLREWLVYNPMYSLVVSYHEVLLYNRAPDWHSLMPIALVSALFLLASLFVFRRASPEMVDVL